MDRFTGKKSFGQTSTELMKNIISQHHQKYNTQLLDKLACFQVSFSASLPIDALKKEIFSLYGDVVGVGDYLNQRATPAGQDLATAVFNHVSNVAITDTSIQDTFSGSYPKYPKHTHTQDKLSTILTIQPEYTHLSRTDNFPFWHTDTNGYRCECCFHSRVVRLSKQVESELRVGECLRSLVVTEKQFKKWVANLKYRKETAVYMALRQENGEIFLVHNQEKLGGELIPHDRGQIYAMLGNYAETNPNRQVGYSRGFGREYQGIRGDGRAKQAKRDGGVVGDAIQAFTWANIKAVCEATGAKLRASANSVGVEINQFDLIQRCLDAGITIYDRKGQFVINTIINKILGESGNEYQSIEAEKTMGILETDNRTGNGKAKESTVQSANRGKGSNNLTKHVGNTPAGNTSQQSVFGQWGRGGV